jgi:hypothetical protein
MLIHLSVGGFAFFGPQQFEDPIWVQMSEPACNGQLFFAGEASSACHASVSSFFPHHMFDYH